MSDTVINGAIGKSPIIDKMNKLEVNEKKSKVAAQVSQYVCSREGVRYPSSSVSFQGCKRAMEGLMAERRKGIK